MRDFFKTHDIRGKYEIGESEKVFQALGATLSEKAKKIILGMDYREHNRELANAFSQGFQKRGGEAILIGHSPTPCTSFLSKEFGASITASHNPPEYNGIKFFEKQTYFTEKEMRWLEEEFQKHNGNNQDIKVKLVEEKERITEYLERIPEIRKGLFDLCGGAVCALSSIFPNKIFYAPDPTYERHSPEPKPGTITELQKECVSKREVGFAFDGDGDRVIVCDSGKILDGDVVAAFVSSNVLKKGSKVILSIDCSQETYDFIKEEGNKAIWSKVGDTNMLSKATEVGAEFSAERSGHYSFLSHSPASDGIYAAAVLSEFDYGEFAEFSKNFKDVTLKEEEFVKIDFQKLEEEIKAISRFMEMENIDGIKAKFEEFTLLIRASNTEPKIRINSEASELKKAKEGMKLGKELMLKARLS